MTTVEVVLGAAGGRRLILRSPHPPPPEPYWRLEAQLVLPAGAMTRDVAERGTQLARFFGELAADWRGFDGRRQYDSFESELFLSCRHDGFGTVSCEVGLGQRWDPAWWLMVSVELEAGQLDRIAAEVRALVGPRSDG